MENKATDKKRKENKLIEAFRMMICNKLYRNESLGQKYRKIKFAIF